MLLPESGEGGGAGNGSVSQFLFRSHECFMAEDPVDRGGEGDKKTIPSSSVKKGGANTSVALSNNKLYDQESNVVKRQVSKLVACF